MMKGCFAAILLMVLTVAPLGIHATTFARTQETCPVCDKPTTVAAVMSYGSYIYDWDSKYDFIYFPFDGSAMFWYSPDCGYVQLSPHFSPLTTAERTDVAAYLDENFTSGEDLSFLDKMKRTREIARARGMSEDDFAWLNRVLIYNAREIDAAFVRELAVEEIALLEAGRGKLQADVKTRPYLIGEYYRITGNEAEARQRLAESASVNLASEEIRWLAIDIAMGLILLGTAIFILVKKLYKKKARIWIVAALVLISIANGFFAWRYFVPRYQYDRQLNKYFTEIARDRLALMDGQESANGNDPAVDTAQTRSMD
jgi:hypothetical protein